VTTKLVGVESKAITKDLARWLYNLATVPGERTIKQSRLAVTKADLANGNVIAFRWAYATCNGVTYRVNGQHTSYILQNGEPIPPGAICTLEHYVCDSVEDVCKLWSLFDSSTSSRTNTEVTSNYQLSKSRIANCRQRSVQLCKSALGIERFGAGYTNKVSVVQKLEAINGNEEFLVWADAILADPALKRVGTAYAMLKTWRKDHEAAERFWNEVKDGTNTNKDSGSRALQRFLLTTNVDSGNGTREGKKASRKTANWNQIATVALTCWNAWRSGRAVTKIFMNKDMPDAI